MPEFIKYVQYVEVDVNLDVDEFLDECSSDEIKKVIEWLTDSDYIKSYDVIDGDNMNLHDLEYINMVNKLTDPMVRFRLSEEDLSTLKQIADKL
jgi:hypothetical protein